MIAASIRYKLDTRISDHLLSLLQAYLTPESIDPVVGAVAKVAAELLAAGTPGKNPWGTGNLRANWQIEQPGIGSRLIFNPTKIRTGRGEIYLLDLLGAGNDPGGGVITPTTKQYLFVPMTARARLGWNKGLKYGEDYLLLKSVKAAIPDASTRPVPTMTPRIQKLFNTSVMKYITQKTGIKFK